MAATVITITIPEADLTRVGEALCKPAELPVTVANSKKVLRTLLEARVVNYERQVKEAAVETPAPPEGITVT